MEDKHLKAFLSKNSIVPHPPHREWLKLVDKMQKKPHSESSWYQLFKIKTNLQVVGASFMLILLFVGTSKIYQSNQMTSKSSDLESFMISDSYFTDIEETHSWVEDF